MLNVPVLVVALLVVDSLHFVFGALLLDKISPAVSALYVLAIGTIEVGLYGLATKRLKWSALRPHLPFFLAIGFLVGASTNINYEAVAFIDPGTASLLAQTGTIFGVALGVLWLREAMGGKQALGAAVAILGVFVIEYQGREYMQLGSVLVIGSAFLYALHTALAKRFGQEMDFVNFFFFRLLFTTGFLFTFSAARGALAWPALNVWPLLLLVGTTDIVISRTLYYLALRRLTLSLHTITLTLSPVAAVLWALALFGTRPTIQQLLGGAAVLLGVGIVSLTKRKQDAGKLSPAD
jgi:O-acetylserine/cysteine efflux transporter